MDGLLVNRISPHQEPIVVESVEPQSTSRWWMSRAAIVTLVILGAVLRGVAWMSDRNLWIDESMLALNLVERPPARLLEPLDWNQGAPVGFLLAVKSTISALGVSERTLRLLPLVGSCLGLFGFAWLAPRLLPRPAALLALALFSVAPFLISYSAECKQYATDAAIAVGLFACSVGLLQGKSSLRRGAVLGGAGAAAVWFSHPAAFVLGGIGSALLLDALLKRDHRRFLAAAATAGCWLMSFAICYLLFLKNLGGNAYLLTYWDGHFLPLPPKFPGDLAWLADHFFAPFAYPGGLGGTEIRAGGIAAVFFLVGIAGLWKRSRTVALALVLPGFFALLASGLHKYPYAGRLLLFLVPMMILGVANGAAIVATTLGRTQPFAASVLLGVLLAAPCLEAFQELKKPMRYEQLDPVLAQVRSEWQPGDRMYLYYGALPAYTYYSQGCPFPDDAVVNGTEARVNAAEYRAQLVELKGSPRVWVVFSHRHKHEESTIQAYAEGLGRCERAIRMPGASAFLFNFAVLPDSSGVPSGTRLPERGDPSGIARGGDR